MKCELAEAYRTVLDIFFIFLKNSLNLGQVFLVSLIVKLGYVTWKVDCDVMRLIL